MHDIAWIRDHPEAFDVACAKRGLEAMSSRLLDLDKSVRGFKTTSQELQQRRNELSKAIGQAKSKGEDAAETIAEVGTIKEQITALEEGESAASTELNDLLAGIPNMVDDLVPEGADEDDNVEDRRWGEAPSFDFEPKDHADIGTGLGLMDFDLAAELSGARFVVLTGALARMEKALALFMLDIHTQEFGYTEVSSPLLVRPEVAYSTGNLPKFAEDLFQTTDGRYLIPTAEMTLTNFVRESITEEETLPRRLTAFTPCFRSEAGSAGRDTKGMIRQHQFWKVELVSITTPEQSADEHQHMTRCAETILQRLGLAYRVMVLATGDIGFSAQRTYDLEVWLPGQGLYREISSCSNCGDFQARRMRARCRPKGEKKTRFVHTLNGSGLAVGRALVAVLENYQNADGSVTVPEVLRPYMNGLERIEAKN
ncbi:MAG: serine--tRNA ligase [Rhodospirillaceae bacterium]|jgi:seryl-tRNA synthetase|nr:serine--tRNA ligase [Rhodospirillaceae bacterium]MBT6204588.1 serine--tRNA ligase [Rhodospirillaceae bacterium]MBT6509217.1 serine--tRNA ligase [Rhodospirillaceae bacterium]MBT7614584.1 serine--tRNA ligase [Rhodospirillaceae bacterium]